MAFVDILLLLLVSGVSAAQLDGGIVSYGGIMDTYNEGETINATSLPGCITNESRMDGDEGPPTH